MAIVEGGFRKLPISITDRVGRSKSVVRMGLFQEIHRAWITLDTDINDKEWPRSDNVAVGGTREHDLILWDYNSDEVIDPIYSGSSVRNIGIDNDDITSHALDDSEDGNGLVKYGLSSISYKSWTSPVLSVGLVVPRGDSFEPSVKYLLTVCTAEEVTVLVLHFDMEIGRLGPVPSIHSTMKIVHHPDGFIFPTDGIRFGCVAGSSHGRIFLGGSDGCIHEIETNTDELISGGGTNSDDISTSLTSSFNISGVIGGTATAVSGYVGSVLGIAYLESVAKKMKRTNREITTGMAMIKSLVGSQSNFGYRITHLCVDHERNLLYSVSIDGRLSVYSLGAAGNEFSLVSRIECMDHIAKKYFTDRADSEAEARLFEEKKAVKELKKLDKDIASFADNGLDTFLQSVAPVQSKAWPIVALNVVKVSESKRIHLVATALSGARFYFTTLTDEKFKEPINPPNISFENQRKHNDGVVAALLQPPPTTRPASTSPNLLASSMVAPSSVLSSSSTNANILLADSPVVQLPKRDALPGCDLRLVYVRLSSESVVLEGRKKHLIGRESIASLVVPGVTTFLAVPSQGNGDSVITLTRDWLNNRVEEDHLRPDKAGNLRSLVPVPVDEHHLRPASLAYESNQASLGKPAVMHQAGGPGQQQQQQRLSKFECLSVHLASSLPSKSLVYAIGEVNREPSAVLDSCIFTPSGALLLPDGETAPLPYRSFDVRRGGGGLQLLEPGSGPLSVSQFDALPVSGAAVATGKKKRERDDPSAAAAATAFAQDDLVGAIIKQKVLEESSVPTRYSHLVRRRIWASGGSHDAEPLYNEIIVPSLSGGTFDVSPTDLSITYDLRASSNSFVILTSEGIHRIRKVRVIDQLSSILSHVSNSPHSPALQPKRQSAEGNFDPSTSRKPIQTAELRNPLLESFFTKMPVREEAFAQIAAVACGFTSKSQLTEWRGPRGSRPAEDACRSLSDGGGERDTARRSLRAFGGDPSWKPNSSADILAAKNGMSALSRDDSGYSSRDLTFSPKFGGLTLLLSRLLRPFWRKTLFIAPPGKQTLFTPSLSNSTLAVSLGSKPAYMLSGSSLNAVKVERDLLVPRFTSAECLELHLRLSAFIELFEETFEHALKIESNEDAYKQIVRSLGSTTAKTLGRDSWISNQAAPVDDFHQRSSLHHHQPRSDIEIEGTKKRKAMEMEILHQFLVLRLARRAREAAALMAAVSDPANGVSHSLLNKARGQARENDELVKLSKVLSWRDLITLPSGEIFADRLFSLTLKMLLAEQVKRESKGGLLSNNGGVAVGGGVSRPNIASNLSSIGGASLARFFGFGTSSMFSGDLLKSTLGGVVGAGSSSVVASATQLSSYLRRAAPSFFSEGQALLVHAKDVTNKACRHAASVPAESKRLFAEAQDLLSQAVKALSVSVLLRRWEDVKSIMDQFCASEFYEGVLAVTTSVALRCANNDASALDASLPPDFIAPAEGSYTLARKKAYRTVTDMLDKKCEQDRINGSNADAEMKLNTTDALLGVPSLLLPQSALVILRDALFIRDRGFHFSLYEWLLEKDLHEILVEADTDYVEHYLDSRARSSANNANEAYSAFPINLEEVKKHLSSRRKFKEWLALFHANKGRFDLSSQVFYDLTQERWDTSQMDAATIATTRTLNPELQYRTHCLNRAIENAERINGGTEPYLRVWKNDIKVLQVQGSLLRYGETYDKHWRTESGGSYESLFSEDDISSLKYEIFDVDRIIRFSERKNVPEFAIDVLDVYRNPLHRKKVESLYMGDLETGELGILGQIASAALGDRARDEIRQLSPHLMHHDFDASGNNSSSTLHFDSQKAQSVIAALQNVCKYYSTKFRPEQPLGGGGGDFSFPLTSIIAYLEIERALEGDGYRKYVEEEGGQYDFLWVAVGCFGEGVVGYSVREEAYRKLLSEFWREAGAKRTNNQRSFRPFIRLVIVWSKIVTLWANRSLRHAHSMRSHRDVLRSYREVGVDPDALEPHKKDLLREVKSLQDKIRHLNDITHKGGVDANDEMKELTEATSLLDELLRKIEDTPDLHESAFNPNRSGRQSRFGQSDLSYGGFE
jgi:hypothetical protein